MAAPKELAAGSKARRGGGSARDPVAAVGRAVETALDFVKRCVPGPSVRRPAAPGRERQSPGRSDDGRPALSDLRARLGSQIAALEREIEAVHARIARGPGPDQRPTALLQRSRALRDELHRARQELTRVERHLAREDLLRASSREIAGRSARAGPRPRAAELGPAPRQVSGQRARGPTGPDEVVEARGRRAQRGEVARLRQALSARDAETRRAAAVRLGAIGTPDALRQLLFALEDSNERVVQAALNAFARAKRAQDLGLFRRFLQHPAATLRVAALRGVAAGAPRALGVSELAGTVDDPDPEVRKAGAALLGQRGWARSPEAAGALTFALRDPVSEVRLAAIDALRTCGDEAGVLRLIRAVADPVPAVHEAALAALRGVVGTSVDSVGAGLEPARRAEALAAWWSTARVDLGLTGAGAGRADGLAEPVPRSSLVPAVSDVAPEPRPQRESEVEPEAERASVEPAPPAVVAATAPHGVEHGAGPGDARRQPEPRAATAPPVSEGERAAMLPAPPRPASPEGERARPPVVPDSAPRAPTLDQGKPPAAAPIVATPAPATMPASAVAAPPAPTADAAATPAAALKSPAPENAASDGPGAEAEPAVPEVAGDDDFLAMFQADETAEEDEESAEGDEPSAGGGEEYENIFGNDK